MTKHKRYSGVSITLLKLKVLLMQNVSKTILCAVNKIMNFSYIYSNTFPVRLKVTALQWWKEYSEVLHKSFIKYNQENVLILIAYQ